MSSITFPYSGPGYMSSASSSSGHEHHEYSPAFDDLSNSSFQMNPLSSHPPRTPRPSVVCSSYSYSAEVYNNGEDTKEKSRTYEEETDDGDEDKVDEDAQNKVRKEEIWRELLVTSNGRDKAFKLMQYSLRLYLMLHGAVMSTAALKNKSRPPWEVELVKRCESSIAGFSLTRKCLILFNWLTPLTSILTQHSSMPFVTEHSSGSSLSKTKGKPLLHTFLHAPPPVLLGLINGLSDDVYTFSKLGLIGRRIGERAGRFADWCWFTSTLVDLVENTVERGVILDLQHQVESRLYAESMTGSTGKSNPAAHKLDEKELARLQRQDYWIQMTRLKLLMDLIFVSYNVFRLKRAKSQVQTFTGLAAAALR
ncbi:hypothetical protein AcW1_004517 [Taiwanofungus camphoratus]|nr:hypothetical protein AcW1_004517 [Antrodia cinnamomea]